MRDIDTTGIDTAKVTSKTDLASLKARIDNLDVDKNETAPADLSKLSNVLDNDLVKKKLCMINWLPKSMLLKLRQRVILD